MLEATEFDIKTGQTLTQYDPQTQQRAAKTRVIRHSYLEHWLTQHNLADRPLWVAKFYPGVVPADWQQLEQDEKVLLFTNAETGYFSDAETARLLNEGDSELGIEPLYGYGKDSAHFLSAYGSLPISDGGSSTVLTQNERGYPICILVVDEEERDLGSEPLLNVWETPASLTQIDLLLERLGDGVMLVSPTVSHALLNPDELKHEIRQHLEEATPSELWVEQLAEDYSTDPDRFSALLADSVTEHRIVNALKTRAQKTVSQFRAATPELPGMLKGTLSSSSLVNELGVDVICSVSCIKGDDGRLSRPGIHEISQLWLNRKLDGRYRTQAVGAQFKGSVPDATAGELNPKVFAQAQAFAEMAGDVERLAAHYLKEQDVRRGSHRLDLDDPAAEIEEEEDWLSQLVRQDRYGILLNGFPTVVDKLERFVRQQRLDQALRGIRVPSAIAQPHGQLKPWEVCNRSLPEGAIVAYYRSPLPSISAVAMAINNTGAVEQNDPTAFRQHGVAYLNPWTARQIAITDFDGDVNGYFVGYVAAERGLPQQIREQLQHTETLSPAQQYEAARQHFATLMAQLEQNPESALIRPADYPQTVSEVIERTAPERKPPAIAKLPKLKHTWNDNETLTEATWRAWGFTAENPIGRVANAGMVLQSFAAECLYARSDETQEALLNQISTHAQKQLRLSAEGKLDIPSNDTLTAKGFAAYDLQPRLQSLAQASSALKTIRDPVQRQQHIAQHLQAAHDLLLDVAEGPNAANLQTAVDAAKSAKGIDEQMYRLALALQYKPHLLRQHRKDLTVYTAGRILPTNTDEPIGWMVESVNRLYKQTALQRANNVGMRFGSLMDGIPFTPDQSTRAKRIVTAYLNLMQQRSDAQHQQQRNPSASRQPMLTVTSQQSGRSILVERLIDATTGNETAVQDLWRTSGPTDWTITIEPQHQSHRLLFAVKRLLPQYQPNQPPHLLGWVSEASVQEQNLRQLFRDRQQPLLIQRPIIEVHPPTMLQNDAEALLDKATHFLKEAKAAIPVSEHSAYAAAMWSLKLPTGEQIRERDGQSFEKQAKLGMAVALQLFPEVVGKHIQQLPPLTLSGCRYREITPEPGEYQVVTRPYQYLDKAGYVREMVGVALLEPGGDVKYLGYLGDRSLQLPVGLKLQAEIHLEASPQNLNREEITVQVQELWGREPTATFLANQETDKQYAPTYQELQDWWRAAKRRGDGETLEAIAALGQRLVELYSPEKGSTPPADYRNLRLLLSPSQQQQMHQELKRAVERPLTCVSSRDMERG